MTLTRAQKEAKLREVADEVIGSYLTWGDENSAPNLTQIEDKILELRQQMGQILLEVTVASQEMNQPAESPKCTKCGEEMRYKGQKEKVIESRVGGLAVERGYYHCARCGSGFFPPGPATGVGEGAVEREGRTGSRLPERSRSLVRVGHGDPEADWADRDFFAECLAQ